MYSVPSWNLVVFSPPLAVPSFPLAVSGFLLVVPSLLFPVGPLAVPCGAFLFVVGYAESKQFRWSRQYRHDAAVLCRERYLSSWYPRIHALGLSSRLSSCQLSPGRCSLLELGCSQFSISCSQFPVGSTGCQFLLVVPSFLLVAPSLLLVFSVFPIGCPLEYDSIWFFVHSWLCRVEAVSAARHHCRCAVTAM
jgi:hypothetical protein